MRKFPSFRRDQRGSASVEFAIAFPLIFAVLFALFESGWIMTRTMMLERGVDMASRNLRVGAITTVSHDGLKAEICEHSTILANCTRDLILELMPKADASVDYPKNQANCKDRTETIAPVIAFTPTTATDDPEIMFIRACIIIDPIFPGIGIGLGLPKDSSGGYQLVSYTAFVNEPT